MRLRRRKPVPLEDVVAALRYKPNWRFEIKRGPSYFYPTLVCRIEGGPDLVPEPLSTHGITLDADSTLEVTLDQSVPIPDDQHTWDEWEDWLVRAIAAVEVHEACEFFRIMDGHGGRRPFWPHEENGDAVEAMTIRRRKKAKRP